MYLANFECVWGADEAGNRIGWFKMYMRKFYMTTGPNVLKMLIA